MALEINVSVNEMVKIIKRGEILSRRTLVKSAKRFRGPPPLHTKDSWAEFKSKLATDEAEFERTYGEQP